MQRAVYVRLVAFVLIVAGVIAGFLYLGELVESAPWGVRFVLAVALIAWLATWASKPSPGEPPRR